MRCVHLAFPLLLCACSSPAFSTLPEEDVGTADDGIVMDGNGDVAPRLDVDAEAGIEVGEVGEDVASWTSPLASGTGFPVRAKGLSRDYGIAAYPDIKTVGDFFVGVFPTPKGTSITVGRLAGEWHVDNGLVDVPGCVVRFVVRLTGYDVGIFDVTAKSGPVVRFKLVFPALEIPTGFYLRYEVVSGPASTGCGALREPNDPTSGFSVYAP